MNESFLVNGSLAIDLLPSVDDDGRPALCLYSREDPEQAIVISLSEIYVLRDVLAQAGARLAQVEAITRKQRKTAMFADIVAN
jgi:hypothetical protein